MLTDCTNGIFSDNCINGTELLFYYIAMLFSMMLSQGVAPQGLLLFTLVPIPKLYYPINIVFLMV